MAMMSNQVQTIKLFMIVLLANLCNIGNSLRNQFAIIRALYSSLAVKARPWRSSVVRAQVES